MGVDILDLSKIEAGRMDLFREVTALPPMISGVLSTASGLTKDKPIELELDLPDDLPLVDIDRVRVRQVLLNLLSNAAKFTKEGTISVRAAQRGAFVQIDVQDSGIGIAPEHQTLVFEEFRQIEDEFTRSYQGTGLGLPICKRLVELHGGRIWFESTPGVGSTFSFSIPVAATVASLLPTTSSVPAAPAGTPNLPQKNTADMEPFVAQQQVIAVIDDDPDAQRIVREQLAPLNCPIHPLLDSQQALAQLRQIQPQLIILDLHMPAPSGWELLAQLRADPLLAPIPVIIYSVVDGASKQFALSATDCLVKPVDEARLIASVQRWLRQPATVLVVDDDPDARRIARDALETHYQVIEAADGAQALHLVQTTQPQLVVLDLMMPELDGFTLLARMREDTLTAQIPVIVVTAKNLEAHERHWLSEHAHLLSPKGTFSLGTLTSTVQELLDHR